MTDVQIVPASYKDPAGFVFIHKGLYYRQINKTYSRNYDQLIQSGLYEVLTGKGYLISHTEVDNFESTDDNCYKILLPQQLEFISYAYEWSFNMLKDAALLTLEINRIAIKYGMILKDATPFNIQFHKCEPIFIDTLSFEQYDSTKPWIAYRQFCESFLFPLYLCHYTKTDAQRWLAIYPDGINVSETASLLPFKSRLRLGVWLHVYLQKNISQKQNITRRPEIVFSQQKLFYLLDGLSSTIKSLSPANITVWSNYYDKTILSNEYLLEKEIIFREYLEQIVYTDAIDLGANDGHFSRILSEKASFVLAIDSDSSSINNLYGLLRQNKTANIQPLIIDITNPTAAIGLANEERLSLLNRVRPSLIVALALVHHLAISKNIPLLRIADLFARISTFLIIEFVSKKDPKLKQLLENKADIYTQYNENKFEDAFNAHFVIIKKTNVPRTDRIMYLMRRK